MAPNQVSPPQPVDLEWLYRLLLQAGELLLAAAGRRHELCVDHKGRVDLVTGTDFAIQEFLIAALRAAYPDDAIVAEEGESEAGTAPAVWYLDPVDGTTNFVHADPACAVSVARWVQGVPEVGIVYAPLLDELYCARRGEGATLERPLRKTAPVRVEASRCRSLDDALVATGFPYHRGATARLNLAICAHALTRVHGLRRGGSAALDLCHVASGQLDAYWEMGLRPWDLGAAALIAREAGARVTDFVGNDDILSGVRVAAAAPALHPELLELLALAHAHPDLEALGPLPAHPASLTGPLPSELF